MLVAGLDIGTSSICGLLYDAGTDNVAETVNSKNEAHIRSSHVRPYFNNGYLYVAASLNGGRVLAELAEFLSQCCEELMGNRPENPYAAIQRMALEEGSILEVVSNFYGTRGSSDIGGQIRGIGGGNFTPGALARGFVHGIAWELLEMYRSLPPKICESKAFLAGAGNGFRKNPALAGQVEAQLGLPLRLSPGEEAAYGAALYAVHAWRKDSPYI